MSYQLRANLTHLLLSSPLSADSIPDRVRYDALAQVRSTVVNNAHTGGVAASGFRRRRFWTFIAVALVFSIAAMAFEVGVRQVQPDTVIYEHIDGSGQVVARVVITDPERVALWAQEIPSGRPVSFIQQDFSDTFASCHSITSGAHHDHYTYTFLRRGITVRFVEQSWWSCGLTYHVSSGGLPDWNEYRSGNVVMP